MDDSDSAAVAPTDGECGDTRNATCTLEELVFCCARCEGNVVLRHLAATQLRVMSAWLAAAGVYGEHTDSSSNSNNSANDSVSGSGDGVSSSNGGGSGATLQQLLQQTCTLTSRQQAVLAAWTELLADKLGKMVASEYAYRTMPCADTAALTLAVASMREAERYNNHLMHQLYNTPEAAAAALREAMLSAAASSSSSPSSPLSSSSSPLVSTLAAATMVSKRARRLHDAVLVVLLRANQLRMAAHIVVHLVHHLHRVSPAHTTRLREVLRGLCGQPCEQIPPGVCWDALLCILRQPCYGLHIRLQAPAAQLCRYTKVAGVVGTATRTACGEALPDDEAVDAAWCELRPSQMWLYRDTVTQVHVVQRQQQRVQEQQAQELEQHNNNNNTDQCDDNNNKDADAADGEATSVTHTMTPNATFAWLLDAAAAAATRRLCGSGVVHDMEANYKILQHLLHEHQEWQQQHEQEEEQQEQTAVATATPATDDAMCTLQHAVQSSDTSAAAAHAAPAAVAATCPPVTTADVTATAPTAPLLTAQQQRQMKAVAAANVRATQMERQLKSVLRLNEAAVVTLAQAGVLAEVLRSDGWVPLQHIVACLQATVRPSSALDTAATIAAATAADDGGDGSSSILANGAMTTMSVRSVADLVELLLTQHNMSGRYEVGVCDVATSAFVGLRCARALYAHAQCTVPPLWRRILCKPARRIRARHLVACRHHRHPPVRGGDGEAVNKKNNNNNNNNNSNNNNNNNDILVMPTRAWLHLDSNTHLRKWHSRVLLPSHNERPLFILVARAALTRQLRYRNTMAATGQPCLDNTSGTHSQLLFVEVRADALVRDVAHTRVYAGPSAPCATRQHNNSNHTDNNNDVDDDDEAMARRQWCVFTNYTAKTSAQIVGVRTRNRATANFVLDNDECDDDDECDNDECDDDDDGRCVGASGVCAAPPRPPFVTGGGLPLFFCTGRCAVLYNSEALPPPPQQQQQPPSSSPIAAAAAAVTTTGTATSMAVDNVYFDDDDDEDTSNSDSDEDASAHDDNDGSSSSRATASPWRIKMRRLSERVLPRTMRARQLCASLALPDNPFRRVLTSHDAARLFGRTDVDAHILTHTPVTRVTATTTPTAAATATAATTTRTRAAVKAPTDEMSVSTSAAAAAADAAAAATNNAADDGDDEHSSAAATAVPAAHDGKVALDVLALRAQVSEFARDERRCVMRLHIPAVGEGGVALQRRRADIEALKDYMCSLHLHYQLCKTRDDQGDGDGDGGGDAADTTSHATMATASDGLCCSSSNSNSKENSHDNSNSSGRRDGCNGDGLVAVTEDAAAGVVPQPSSSSSSSSHVYELRKRFLFGSDDVLSTTTSFLLPARLTRVTSFADLLRRALTRECENALANYEILEFTGDAMMDLVVVLDTCALKMQQQLTRTQMQQLQRQQQQQQQQMCGGVGEYATDDERAEEQACYTHADVLWVLQQKPTMSALASASPDVAVLTKLCNNKVLALLLPPAVMARFERSYGAALRHKVLADVFEAVVGAVYRATHDVRCVRHVIRRLFARLPRALAAVMRSSSSSDNKRNAEDVTDGEDARDSDAQQHVARMARVLRSGLDEVRHTLTSACGACPYMCDCDGLLYATWPLSGGDFVDAAMCTRYGMCSE